MSISSPSGDSPRTGRTLTAARADSWGLVIRRLYDDCHGRATLWEVASTVCGCRSELDIVAEASLPEMVERLARQRLTAGGAAGRAESSA